MLNAAKGLGRKKDKLFNFRPAFFAAVSLIFGIIFGYYKIVYGISAWWLLSLVPIVVLPFFFCEGKGDFAVRFVALSLLLATFFLGFSAFRYQLYDYTRCGYYNGEHTVVGTVVSYVDNEGSFKVVLKDISIDEKEEKGTLNAYLPTSYVENIHIADIVLVCGKVQTDTAYSKGEFNAYAIDDTVRFTLSGVTSYEKVGRSKDVFLRIRDRVERVVCNGMDESSASVVLGVLVGDTTKIEGGLLENMRQGGIAHIFAVSGLHVGALYAFVLLLFSKTRLKTSNVVFRFVTLSAILLFYAAICGFSPSIVRATVLCLVGYAMRNLGGATDSLNTLGLAAVIILLFTPCALFEIGFQLSFAACLGIVLFAKRIGQVCDECYKTVRKIYPRRYTEEEKKALDAGDTLPPTVGERFYRAVTSVVSASLAAQLFTAPLQYLAFGYFSGWSFLLNLIFVPLISVAFAGILLIVVLACLLPIGLSGYLLYIPAMLFHATLLVFEVVDFSSFAITNVQLSHASCVCYYGGVIFLTDKWNVSKKQRICLSVLCFTAFIAILALLNL